MGDYGQDLQFGTFITPGSADPQHTVDLAVLTERVGLDLVTFQDHPYQPAFLDTWTLMSYVAARTERVQISANVINLPLRPPGVLARAAASLDLLSGGRFDLALGAGAGQGCSPPPYTGECLRSLDHSSDVSEDNLPASM